MVFNERFEACPICGSTAKVTRKWVTNSYGKRYDYFLYHHQGFIHYSNKSGSNSRDFRKGELEKILIETVNSQDFKLGSFRINDIKKILAENFPDVTFGSIKNSLSRLAEIGIIEKRLSGRNISFVNTVSKDRLSFIIESLSIGLEDIDGDDTFKEHIFIYSIKNDHSWPLYYMPFRCVGDVDITFEELKLQASDPSNSESLRVVIVEDGPRDKRILLKFNGPLLPGESRGIRIEYRWSEPKQSFVSSVGTKIDSFAFSVSGINGTKLSSSLTMGSRNETQDLSAYATETSTKRWKSVSIINLSNVEPFSVLQFKWKYIKDS